MNKAELSFVLWICMCALAVILFLYITDNFIWGGEYSCKFSTIGKDELDCVDFSNISMFHKYTVVNRTQQELDRQQGLVIKEQNRKQELENQICYNQGYDVNISFDIQKDYGYSCNQLEYINDHFVDQVDQKDGGYIKGSGSGFGFGVSYIGIGFGSSHSEIKGQFYEYIVTKVSATGHLVENVNYHITCKNETKNEVIDYYTEGEFVMYYVNNCIERNNGS